MLDELDELIKGHLPTIKDDPYAKLLYDVFIATDKGRMLIAQLFQQYVNRPFTDIMSKDPVIDPNKIFARAMQRDLVQSMLVIAQQYEASLKQK